MASCLTQRTPERWRQRCGESLSRARSNSKVAAPEAPVHAASTSHPCLTTEIGNPKFSAVEEGRCSVESDYPKMFSK
jgi:hypothetical protein